MKCLLREVSLTVPITLMHRQGEPLHTSSAGLQNSTPMILYYLYEQEKFSGKRENRLSWGICGALTVFVQTNFAAIILHKKDKLWSNPSHLNLAIFQMPKLKQQDPPGTGDSCWLGIKWHNSIDSEGAAFSYLNTLPECVIYLSSSETASCDNRSL